MHAGSSNRNRSLLIKGKSELICPLLLIGFTIFLFRDALFGGELLFGSDFVGCYQGLKQFLHDEVSRNHSIPYWNPYLFGGMPFWAHFESTIFYPLDILFWFMSPEKAFGYTMFIHLTLAGLFMYLFARSLRLGQAAAFVSGIVFSCNGFVMATLWDGQMFRVQAYIWLPLILFFLNRALILERPIRHSSLAGLFWGIQILSGSPQDALYTLMASFLFLVCNFQPQQARQFISWRAPAVFLCLFVFGVSVAAIQLVPAFEFIRLSVRAVFDSYDLVTLGSYPPQGIITAILPHFFGNYAKGNYWVSGVPWTVPLYNLYVGILPLILLSFMHFRKAMDKRIVVFGGILATLSFFLALGYHTPLYRLLYHLPGVDRIRAPAKIIYLWVFGMSLLAGKGMNDLLKRDRRSLFWPVMSVSFVGIGLAALMAMFRLENRSILTVFSPFILETAIPAKMPDALLLITSQFHHLCLMVFLALLIMLLWMRGMIRSVLLFTVLLSLLLMIDLFSANRDSPRYDTEGYQWARIAKENLDRNLSEDTSVFRVGSLPNSMGPNFEMLLGYQTVAGYNPLYLYRYYEYIRAFSKDLLEPGDVYFFYTPAGRRVFMDLLNVKYEISHNERIIRKRSTPLPRAFLVPDCRTLKEQEVLPAMASSGYNPRTEVFFAEGEYRGQCPSEKPGPRSSPASADDVRITFYGPDEMLLEIHSPWDGFLFLSEVYYPGWKAVVDGLKVPVMRGNYLFRVIQIRKGRHIVKLVFDPDSIKVGIWITIASLLGCFFTAAIHFFRRSGSRLK